MSRRRRAPSLGGAAACLLVCASANAAPPTTAECLTASDARITSGNQHKLRAERAYLLVCASPSCPAEVRKDCAGRVDEVNAQIPTIVFSAKESSGADLTAVTVTMDGEKLADQLEGTALSVDPGEHSFVFEASGQAAVTKKFFLVQGQKDRREQITFGTPPAPAQPSAGPPPPQQPRVSEHPPVTLPPATQPGAGMGTQKVLAIVAGGLGVVGLGVGTAFGLMAVSRKNDAQSVCPNLCATQNEVNKWSDASTMREHLDGGFHRGRRRNRRGHGSLAHRAE
jgi:hypothetical protein